MVHILHFCMLVQFSSVAQSCLFATPWTAARQASLTITNSQSLLKLMSIESVMPSSHLILCGPLLPLPSIFPSIRVFSKESPFRIRWPKYWSFSFNIILPASTQDRSPLGWRLSCSALKVTLQGHAARGAGQALRDPRSVPQQQEFLQR